MMAEAAGGATLAIWIYLITARGGFWRTCESAAPSAAPAPAVVAIVPARNEADVVGAALGTLLTQDYAGPFHVVLVDDDSTDGTAERAREAAELGGEAGRLTVIAARPKAPGWTGKLWAVSEGLRKAADRAPEYYLLTDADIAHAADNLSKLVARAEWGRLDLASLMVKLRTESLAERALIPAFVFFFFLLYPPAWVGRKDRRTAAAAGGCILIRAEALERIGGMEAIRGALIDDCALADAVKRTGGAIWLGVTSTTRSLRAYGFGDIERMIARTAFTQLGHSALLLAATAAGMTLTYLAPPLLAVLGHGWAAGLGAGAWILTAIAFAPTLRFYGRTLAWAPLAPLIAAFYLAATVDSALRYWSGQGGEWKGRVQDRKG
ncbi:MAG: glycosyltransferase [Bryobacteraceae bacterium]